jgi:hypothetical protein
LLASLSMILLFSNVGIGQPFIDDDYFKDTIWGKETNGVKAGLMFQYTPDTNHSLVGFIPALNNGCTTNVDFLCLFLPPFDSRYQMALRDANGMAVPKTAKGKALGSPITKPLRGRIGINLKAGFIPRYLVLNNPNVQVSDTFVLKDYFVITNAGKYHFQFDMMVIRPSKENPTNVVHLPPVNAEIEINKP